jgi:SAM-dependent methyltransferase
MKKEIVKFIGNNEYLRKITLDFSLRINNLSYSLIKIFVAAPGSAHPKHAIMNYHKFFVDNAAAGETILDVGCGNGSVAADVADKAARVIGIDISEKNIKAAKEKFSRPNLELIIGDCLLFDFSALGVAKFDKIILSNVLEHLDGRVQFLEKLHKLSDTILLRVPLITRDWLAVYKKEHGYKYFLSAEHKIEFTEEILNQELAESGWKILNAKVNFGEIWAVVIKAN